MSPEEISDIVRQMLLICLEISAPLLLVAMVVGLLISIFQSVTQINEATLSFVPKLFIFAFIFSASFPWMLKMMVKFTNNLLVNQWDKITSLSQYAN